MECPKCQFDNREGAKFCGKCRADLFLVCSQCNSENPPDNDYCDECGQDLREKQKHKKLTPLPEGERKYVTVLFSDLSGYTAMSEKLDPEEVKEIMSRIFGEIAQVVAKYEGFVEKFVGDAVMALFGVPKAHEDDPIRAIKVARDIHELVGALSPELEKRIGQPISMHTGINTGLVVTGEVDMEKGTHGVAGDAVNVASRLSSQAGPGEILVGRNTYLQAEGYFEFEALEPVALKGKTEPVSAHRVISFKERPITIHRLSGIRAELTGREMEMAELKEAAEGLSRGESRIIVLCGEAGTGKSRLMEEFQKTLSSGRIQWLEGHAYPYAQNTPYSLVSDLLSYTFAIEEGDPPKRVGEKIETAILELAGDGTDIIPYVGNLFSLNYPELEDITPEFWQSRLLNGVHEILSGLARRSPTVIVLEDFHWADPSSIELLRSLLLESHTPILFVCIYRPQFNLFTGDQIAAFGKLYLEIRLQDLSSSESQQMLKSLLATEEVPWALQRFFQERVQGNPFYLEEAVNALIDSGTLFREDETWHMTRELSAVEISSSIHGVIAARLDRLEKEAKRVLQEASVIGRSFLYEILRRISALSDHCDQYVTGLERLDFIRAKTIEPEIEYIFKHALTQEVVYNGLLKKERREIHERIARVMEALFQPRLGEFYEILAYHYRKGESREKAIEYLIKSGEKSLARHAVQEADQYYEEAYRIINSKTEKTKEDDMTMIQVLSSWSYAFYYRGDFKKLVELLESHEKTAASLEDERETAMFYVWLGMGMMMFPKPDYLNILFKAEELAEKSGNQRALGHVNIYLSWVFSMMAKFKEGLDAGRKAEKIGRQYPSDHILLFKGFSGVAFNHLNMGDLIAAFSDGQLLLDHGRKFGNHRSLVMGYLICGWANLEKGDLPSAIECQRKAIDAARDPFFRIMPKGLLGAAFLMTGRVMEAEKELLEVIDFHNRHNIAFVVGNVYLSYGALKIAKGQISQGVKIIEDARNNYTKKQYIIGYLRAENLLGNIYLQMIAGRGPKSISLLLKNIPFLIKNIPFVDKKAQKHFEKVIRVAEEIGARGILGQAYLGLGLLHKARKRRDNAVDCLAEAVKIFSVCEANGFLAQAKEALQHLEAPSGVPEGT